MWILKWIDENFKFFTLLNAIVDGVFAFILTGVIKKIKLFTLVRLNEFKFSIFLFCKEFLLHGF